jgi:alkaline phosphatase
MKRVRVAGLFLVLAIVLLSGFAVSAQEDAPPVLILPIDKAQFLPGSNFDFRVEVHARTLPENFSVTINGQPAAEFLGAEATTEDWEFGGRITRFNNEGEAGADFDIAGLAGEYYLRDMPLVTVVAADGVLSATAGEAPLTLTPVEGSPLSFTVAGEPFDGQTVSFGLNADGAVTGFEVGEMRFGLSGGRLPTQSSSVIWREVVAPAAGDYVVEVVAGGTTASATWTVRAPQAGTGRNVILFVADGMTVSMLTAARAAQGITQGTPNNPLAIDSFEYVGLASTSSVDSLMADSANTASALNTGHIGSVNSTGSYSDTSPNTLDDPRTETFAQIIARLRGMSVGVVTTADFSDATPAAVWAHGRNRSDFNRNTYLVQALESGIIDVLLGGGARRMIPQSTEGSRRADDRDLFAEFEDAGFSVATNATELNTLMSADAIPSQLLGVFHPSDLNVWLDRNVYTDNLGDFTDQPGLTDMTLAALSVLNQNANGFYLEVEAASIDKQIHPLDQERALSDLIEFDRAVAAAQAWVAENAPDTTIIVTADHGHGYDVFGTVNVEQFNAGEDDLERRGAIRTYGNAGYPDYPLREDGFPDWAGGNIVFAGTVNNGPDRTENFQVSEVPRVPGTANEAGVIVDNPDDDPNGIVQMGNLEPASTSGVHTLQDVPVYASGPGAECVMGSYHQREIFFCMAGAIGLDPSAENGMVAAAVPAVMTSGMLDGNSLPLLLTLVAGLGFGALISRRTQKLAQ